MNEEAKKNINEEDFARKMEENQKRQEDIQIRHAALQLAVQTGAPTEKITTIAEDFAKYLRG